MPPMELILFEWFKNDWKVPLSWYFHPSVFHRHGVQSNYYAMPSGVSSNSVGFLIYFFSLLIASFLHERVNVLVAAVFIDF